MTLIQAMRTHVRTLDPNGSLEDAAELMTRSGHWMLPVCSGPRLVGSLSLLDLVRHGIVDRTAHVHQTVGDIMVRDPYCCDVEASLEEARDLLCRHRLPAMCVTTSTGDLVGVVDAFEVIESLTAPQGFMGPEPEEVSQVRGR